MAARLLLIDDDLFFCQHLQMTLSNNGFQVEVAHDAISGLRKAYASVPDLVLLDILLPNMDGWEACRRFREMSNVPIIILSALGSTEDVVDSRPAVCGRRPFVEHERGGVLPLVQRLLVDILFAPKRQDLLFQLGEAGGVRNFWKHVLSSAPAGGRP